MLLVGDCLTMCEPARAGAILVRGETIADRGPAEDLCARHPDEHVVRVERITPGVHDAHTHPLLWGQALEELDLGGLSEPGDVAARVAQRARDLLPGRWIRGRGYLFEGQPDSGLIDTAAPNHPVLLESRDIHSGWATRRALALAGVGPDTKDPEGGRFARDARGRPSGYLLERAVAEVARVVPPPGRAELERGLRDLAARGYTATHAMAYPGPDGLEWAEQMAGADALPLRLWWSLTRERWRAVRPGWRGRDLEIAAVKLFADGALGSRTAWMHDPYPDGSSGMPLDAAETIREEGRVALRAGYTLAIHAIGTRAVAEVIGVIRELTPGAARPIRIEHMQHVRDSEIERLHGLPLFASMQPIHLLEDAALVRKHLPGREHEAFRFRDLRRNGVGLAFGSDAPVAKPLVEDGLRAATAHPLECQQSLLTEEALWSFTRGAALAAGWGDYGQLAIGARADLGLWEGGSLIGRVWRGGLEWRSKP